MTPGQYFSSCGLSSMWAVVGSSHPLVCLVPLFAPIFVVEPIANISELVGASFWLASCKCYNSPFPDDQLNLTGAIRITSPAADHVSCSLPSYQLFFFA